MKKRFLISDMKCLTCYRTIQNGQNILEAQWCPRRQNLNLFIHRVRRGPRPSPNRPLARRRPHSRLRRCASTVQQKLERLNVRALRCVYNKLAPLHGDDYGLTVSNRRLQNIAILIFKAVNGMLLGYISDLLVVRNNERGTNNLIRRKKTTNFGLKSTTFIGAKVWNSLPDELRSTTIIKEFENAVRELHL